MGEFTEEHHFVKRENKKIAATATANQFKIMIEVRLGFISMEMDYISIRWKYI